MGKNYKDVKEIKEISLIPKIFLQVVVLIIALIIALAWGQYSFRDLRTFPGFMLFFYVLFFALLVNILLMSLGGISKKFKLRKSIAPICFAYLLILFVASLSYLFGLGEFTKANTATGGRCDMQRSIRETATSTFQLQAEVNSWGTAFMVDDEHMVTAYHVVERAKNEPAHLRPYFIHDSDTYYVSVVQMEPAHDLALLRLDEKIDTYAPLSFDYEQGDEVYALGWPDNALYFGQASLSKGIISRIIGSDTLQLVDQSAPEDIGIIQTDATVNPGNSGGPLVGKCGVVGLVSAKSDVGGLSEYGLGTSEQGINYAITAKTIDSLFGDYIK